MSKTITGDGLPLEDLVNESSLRHIIHLARANFHDFGDRILPEFLRRSHSGKIGEVGNNSYDDKNNEPRVYSTSFGYEMGPISQMGFFPKDKFIPSQIALIDFCDVESKKVQKGESRRTGGPYEAHPIVMLNSYFDTVGKLSIPPDYKMVSTIIGHDIFEDHHEIKALMKQLKYEIRKTQETERLENAETTDIKDLRYQINQRRAVLINEFYREQNLFLGDFDSKNLSKEDDISLTRLGGAWTLGGIDWMTRQTENRYFSSSVAGLFKRYTAGRYSESHYGGPFQSTLMKELGLKNQQREPSDYFWFRVNGKLFDMISQTKETKQKFDPNTKDGCRSIKELERLVQDNPYLLDTYGLLNFAGEPEPRESLSILLYRSFIVLHFLDTAMNTYGRSIIMHRKVDPVAANLLRVAYMARDTLLTGMKKIIDEGKISYEADLSQNDIDKARIVTGAKDEREFTEITAEGPITRWHKLDTMYKDINPQRYDVLASDKFHAPRNYRDFLEFEKLWRKFRDDGTNIFSYETGNIRMFTIGGISPEGNLRPKLDYKP